MTTIHHLLPGVELRCWHDVRFKQGCLSIQFVRPMAEAEAAMNALIPTVLLRGTRQHPDLRSVTMAMDDLYGAAIGPQVRRIGDCQTTGLYCGFMDSRFALPGDRVLEPLVDFVRELLLESRTEDGCFLPEYVESEKKNLISTIESELNDKQAYALGRLLKTMCQGDSFGIPRLGTAQQVAAITPEGLYAHYQKILRESPVRIFYVGSAEPEQVADLLRPVFDLPDRAPMPQPERTALHTGTPGTVTETMDVTQGKLCLGFTTPITSHAAEFAAMQLLNTVYGAGMTSKLFMNVREKLSLCYSVGSAYYGAKGILTVFAGIDCDKQETAAQEILHQLELCRQGEITDAEITAGKEALISSLRSTHDSPGAIESYYSTAAVSGMSLTPEEYMAAVSRVTKDELTSAAKTLELHTTYFLTKEA